MPEVRINESYRPLAEELVRKFPELKDVKLAEVLFVDSDGGGSGDTIKYGEVKKIPDLVSQVIQQQYGKWIRYIVVVYRMSCTEFSREQRTLQMYHQLRHIGEDGLVKHDIEEFTNVAAAIGADWAKTKRKIPDILAGDFDWSKIEGPQLRMVFGGQNAAAAGRGD
jgi:hypothetical protein